MSKAKEALDIIKETMEKEDDYAWGWHCNIAMAAKDEGLDHNAANRAAARFMKIAFDVDTTNNRFYDVYCVS